MSRAKTKDAQLVVRVPEDLIEQLDAYAQRLREEQPGPAWSRADVVRLLLTKSLSEQARKPGARQRKG